VAKFAILPPKSNAGNKGAAAEWRILRHKRLRLDWGLSLTWHNYRENKGAIRRYDEFRHFVANFARKWREIDDIGEIRQQTALPKFNGQQPYFRTFILIRQVRTWFHNSQSPPGFWVMIQACGTSETGGKHLQLHPYHDPDLRIVFCENTTTFIGEIYG
jgi:hypothetical protein